MPWLYHKYAGHDINRDAFMMNLAENRNLARFFYTRLASAGVPDDAPDGDERAAVLRAAEHRSDRSQLRPADLARSAALLGGAMALELQRDRRTGRRLERDVRLLLAGLRGLGAARPQHRLPADRGRQRRRRVADHGRRRASSAPASRGCPTTGRRSTFPNPWPGGRWTLRDIVDYDLSAVRGLLFAAARVPRAARPELLRHGRARGRERARRAARSRSSSRPSSTIRTRPRSSKNCCSQGARRNSARARAVPRRRRRRIRRAPTSSCWRSRIART